MAHLSAQLVLVLLPAPVTLSEMSDCVGAVSNCVALVAKLTFSVAIFFPYSAAMKACWNTTSIRQVWMNEVQRQHPSNVHQSPADCSPAN